jgi:hypothetical protein
MCEPHLARIPQIRKLILDPAYTARITADCHSQGLRPELELTLTNTPVESNTLDLEAVEKVFAVFGEIRA